jgi:predicted dienelactone hydrolase
LNRLNLNAIRHMHPSISTPHLLAVCGLLSVAAMAADYDPLAVPKTEAGKPLEFTVTDAKRSRAIPLRVYPPTTTQPAPVVIFSHGLGGTREGSVFLGQHWAARGYAAVFLQHPGSDDAIWKGQPLRQRASAMQTAASAENYLLRVGDVPAVLDQLARWNTESDHPLKGRLDLTRVGMSGHSFGAVTTQAVSGQALPAGSQPLTDSRIKAAIIMSPSLPKTGKAEQAFGQVKIPWLLMTGTHDLAKIGGQSIGAADMASRLGVYPALPPGGKYEVVLNEARHFVFTDRPELAGEGPRNPNHHRAILALSTAFWDAYLKQDAAAKEWLDGPGPRTILEKEDRWQRK